MAWIIAVLALLLATLMHPVSLSFQFLDNFYLFSEFHSLFHKILIYFEYFLNNSLDYQSS